jgi:dipeptidase
VLSAVSEAAAVCTPSILFVVVTVQNAMAEHYRPLDYATKCREAVTPQHTYVRPGTVSGETRFALFTIHRAAPSLAIRARLSMHPVPTYMTQWQDKP